MWTGIQENGSAGMRQINHSMILAAFAFVTFGCEAEARKKFERAEALQRAELERADGGDLRLVARAYLEACGSFRSHWCDEGRLRAKALEEMQEGRDDLDPRPPPDASVDERETFQARFRAILDEAQKAYTSLELRKKSLGSIQAPFARAERQHNFDASAKMCPNVLDEMAGIVHDLERVAQLDAELLSLAEEVGRATRSDPAQLDHIRTLASRELASARAALPEFQAAYAESKGGCKGLRETLDDAQLTVSDFTVSRAEYGMPAVVGNLKNRSDKTIAFVAVRFTLFDRSGRQVGTTLATTRDLRPADVFRFQAPIADASVSEARFAGVDVF
jgi:hypothetical protein